MASSCEGSPKHSSADASSSDGDVNAVSKELANLNMTGGEDFKRLLECPICMEILNSPIYQCPGGHIICNTCKPKLAKCPSCEAPVGDTRNLALESILQTVLFACNHHHEGCNEVWKIQDLQEHHEECEFRPLKCHLSDKDDCNGTLLYLSDTLSHLQNTHKLKNVKSEDGHSNVFRTLMRYVHPLTYFGLYLIGPKSDASKYSVKISIQKIILEDTATFKSEVTTQFTSIREFQEVWEDEDLKLPSETIVHDDMCFRNNFTPGREWRTVYTIITI